MLRDQCARGELELVVVRAAAALPVRGENAKLRQIFLNLLSNAVKFTEPGGSVTVRTEAAAEGWVLVRICDTGIGMSADDIVTALDPFGQVDSRLARRYQGTGLGLSLAKSLVELHGGTLTIESEPGGGTIVTVMLALAGTADHTIPAEAAA
jgi:signal transduction histidine kinase